MIKQNSIWKIIVIIFLCFNFHTLQAMSCGNDLIEEGDSAAKVLALCGKPALKLALAKDKRTSARHSFQHSSKKSRKQYQWVYDFGRQDFRYLVTIANGKVISITTDGYGGKG